MAKGGQKQVKLDEIGPWSEVKLDIVRSYACEYTKIVRNQRFLKKCLYIDAYAGAGTHISKATGEMVLGSPLNALRVQPPFHEYHFIDRDGDRANLLRDYTRDRKDVHVHEGDANSVLLDKVFPLAKYENYARALCLIDPYAMNVTWEVLKAAGQSKSIEIFFNFMIMDMNMNVLLKDPSKARPDQKARATSLWGDENAWKSAGYKVEDNLFGTEDVKNLNAVVAESFRERLKKVAGFGYVPKPLPMKNSSGAVVYYLYFASPNKTGHKIVDWIFDKHR